MWQWQWLWEWVTGRGAEERRGGERRGGSRVQGLDCESSIPSHPPFQGFEIWEHHPLHTYLLLLYGIRYSNFLPVICQNSFSLDRVFLFNVPMWRPLQNIRSESSSERWWFWTTLPFVKIPCAVSGLSVLCCAMLCSPQIVDTPKGSFLSPH